MTLRDNYDSWDGVLINMDSSSSHTSGKEGMALQFDGLDDYVEIPDCYGVVGGASRVVTAWINTTSHTVYEGTIVSWGGLAPGGQWIVQVWDGKLKLNVGAGSLVGSTAINDGSWRHIAVVLIEADDPTLDDVVLYVDGRAEELSYQSSRRISTIPGDVIRIGRSSSGQFFDGMIDELCVYDRFVGETKLFDGIDF